MAKAKGNPIDHGLANWDAERYPPVEHGDTAPTKLTVNRPVKMWANGLLSSQEWSGQFNRYMTPVFLHAADQTRQKTNWWQRGAGIVAYIVKRLQEERRFPANHLEALFAVRLGGMSWQRAFEQFLCGASDLAKVERHIYRHYVPTEKRAA